MGILEHEANRGSAGGLRAGKLDAAGVGVIEAGDEPEQRRLPAARRSEQRHELARLDRDRYVGDRLDLALGGRVKRAPDPAQLHPHSIRALGAGLHAGASMQAGDRNFNVRTTHEKGWKIRAFSGCSGKRMRALEQSDRSLSSARAQIPRPVAIAAVASPHARLKMEALAFGLFGMAIFAGVELAELVVGVELVVELL